MNCYPFIEAEKSQRRNVKRACELLKVSRSAYYAARDGRPVGAGPRRTRELAARVTGGARGIEGPLRLPAGPRAAARRRACGTPASGSPG